MIEQLTDAMHHTQAAKRINCPVHAARAIQQYEVLKMMIDKRIQQMEEIIKSE